MKEIEKLGKVKLGHSMSGTGLEGEGELGFDGCGNESVEKLR